MTETILKVNSLVKKYGQHKVLDGMSLEIKRGMIYGLIGVNGAGKSTFMRIIMGLTHDDGGMIELFGKSEARAVQAARRKIGQSIETPALYPELNAQDNMKVQAANAGVGNGEIKHLLELMNLQATGKKKVKNFSLGMRQRLTIAMTLISNPEFLILDEPTNGLDPAGIIEIREIIKKLVREKGLTVLISSHILDELSQVATDYGILHHGKIVQELSKEELLQKSQQYIEIRVNDLERAVTILDEMGIGDYEVSNKDEIRIYSDLEQVAQINKQLVMNNIDVYKIGTANQKLEDYFMNITGGK
ncbi:ATP-binding cassette domain-containing protein [Companilactobacillus nodensis]|uniref:Bacitracin ABC transporter, ATP-binding protein BcrA n=1 Tax=Companilactobacillus nodensis DSM 19682 = JCM 14932 = NBRC 107160 TaxID=1423775 RepID=A0A0R1K7Z6_9LACO|nr:ATP-binding cassette domain-containing protein [Companilactobacillus nodensis]KRK79717.1 bacitracin ABC transporter, ATP-binding protein BcrA [Companilactobacillus nodensis DSM 19682 = JCM 14932 = NBRC 107160]